ncbi:MAG TPA: M28 family peptidase [Solirubrobacteraceae bacterium]|nr:M28 family peptidase [Solirubrobacteraceae bacterium]
MLNGRLYRAAFAPFLIALVVVAFSLGSSPAPLTSTLAPDAFEGQQAFAELQQLAARFPHRRPGGPGDEALARYVARRLRALGGTAGGGFSVHSYSFAAQTIAGERTLTTVLAERPGSSGAAPILILAHRDAAAAGAEAELSGTAALLELAQVLSTRATKRTIVLASTSGGSGGAAGAAQLLAQLPRLSGPGGSGSGSFDAAIVLGDLAGERLSAPLVVPYSDGLGSAPLQLQRTLDAAIAKQAGVQAGSPSTLAQLLHLAFPLTVGEQGLLDAGGVPAVLVQSSGESAAGGGGGGQRLSAQRMEGLGRAVLSAVDALDAGPDVPTSMQTSVTLRHKTLPEWAVRLLVAMLMLPPALAAVDGLARARRRRLSPGRWALWTLSCALPFLACAVFAYLLGALGVLGATPAAPAPAGAVPLGARALTAIVAVALAFALSWSLWGRLVRRLGWGVVPDAEVAGLSLALVALALCAIVWVANPFLALLALPALHLWLVLADPGVRPRRGAALALVALGLLPLALLIAYYAVHLGLGPGGVAWGGVLMLAGGFVDFGAALLWSVAFGCAAAAAMLALREGRVPLDFDFGEEREVTIRGPLTYAGPGSLGGTESALRR